MRAGEDGFDEEGDPNDFVGHGTNVAGIVGARSNNAVGVAGTCWSTSLVAVKFMNSRGQGSTSDAIDALEYAVRKGAKVINCSFGSSSASSALHDAVDYAQDKGAMRARLAEIGVPCPVHRTVTSPADVAAFAHRTIHIRDGQVEKDVRQAA